MPVHSPRTTFVRTVLESTRWEERSYVEALETLERWTQKEIAQPHSLGWAGSVLFVTLTNRYPAEYVAIRRELGGLGTLTLDEFRELKSRVEQGEEARCEARRLARIEREADEYKAWLLAGGHP